jgi:hypothetical protein
MTGDLIEHAKLLSFTLMCARQFFLFNVHVVPFKAWPSYYFFPKRLLGLVLITLDLLINENQGLSLTP